MARKATKTKKEESAVVTMDSTVLTMDELNKTLIENTENHAKYIMNNYKLVHIFKNYDKLTNEEKELVDNGVITCGNEYFAKRTSFITGIYNNHYIMPIPIIKWFKFNINTLIHPEVGEFLKVYIRENEPEDE